MKRDQLHQAIGAAKKEAGRALHVKITLTLHEKGKKKKPLYLTSSTKPYCAWLGGVKVGISYSLISRMKILLSFVIFIFSSPK